LLCNINLFRKEQFMGIVEMKLFMFTLGLLIKALLNGKADTEKLKQQIVEAKTKEEVKAALIGNYGNNHGGD